jgi:hypothetical protein
MTENSDPEDMMSFGCNDCVKIVFISWAAVARHIEKGAKHGYDAVAPVCYECYSASES